VDVEALKSSYQKESERAERLRRAVTEQLDRLFLDKSITLGVPLESRVKSWASIEEKLQRKALDVRSITEVGDFVGIRVILLFRTDLEVVGKLLGSQFDVVKIEDTASRLTEVQFGYQSQHYTVKLAKGWFAVPTFAALGELQIEIQVRTLAQHIWAAASHKLQYKHEQSVPPPLRRSIHRVSALLEIVDLEFERVLLERREYVGEKVAAPAGSERLNVDLVEITLGEIFPPENREDQEAYDELLDELFSMGIETVKQLREMLLRQRDKVVESDRMFAHTEDEDDTDDDAERRSRGVYFTFVGLTRQALGMEFGKRFQEFLAGKQNRKAEGRSR